MCDGTGVLTRELRVRVIDISGSGCLIESHRRLEVGTVGRLRLQLKGEEYGDDVRVVRCQAILGAGSVHHVGLQFLWTTRRHARSIRYAVKHHMAALAAASNTTRVM
jgi:PilZ domain